MLDILMSVLSNPVSTTPVSSLYSIEYPYSQINESASINNFFRINYSGTMTSSSITVYYTTEYIGTMSSSDFTSGTSGSISVTTSNAGDGYTARGYLSSPTPNRDGLAEGAEQFKIHIRTGSTTGPIVASTGIITMTASDQTPTGSFTVGTGFNDSVGTFSYNQHGMAFYPDGKIIVGGDFTSYNGTTSNRMILLNPDGSQNTSFNIQGTGFNNRVRSSAIQSDGKILVGGEFNNYNGTSGSLLRLNADGTIDTSFLSGFLYSTGSQTWAIAIQSDNKILVGGNWSGYRSVYYISYLTRLNNDGSVDVSFTKATEISSSVRALAIQSDGKILVGHNNSLLSRLNTDGSQDTNFYNTANGAGSLGEIYAITIQSDGKILVGGRNNSLIRLNADGTRDTNFNIGSPSNAGAVAGIGHSTQLNAITIQSDGKILVGGYFTRFNNVVVNHITRLNSDGSVDTGFNSGGTGFNYIVQSIKVLSDGKILVAGRFTNYNTFIQRYLVRLNSDGSLDTPNNFTL